MKKIAKFVLPLLIIAIGIFGFKYLLATKPKLKEDKKTDIGKLVNYFSAKKNRYKLNTIAYGNTRSSEDWTAISEVKGKAIYINPKFESGEIIEAGSTIIKIDNTDYLSAITSIKLQINDKKELFNEINTKEQNLNEIITLRKKQVNIAKKELNRQKSLFSKGVTTDEALNRNEDNYISRLMGVKDLENQLKLLPIERKKLSNGIAILKNNLVDAERSLSKTIIKIPFTAKCVNRNVKDRQLVNPGERLGMFYDINSTKIDVMLEPNQIVKLLPQNNKNKNQVKNLKAEVSWELGNKKLKWEGIVENVGSNVDLKTQTIPLTIKVNNPDKNVLTLLPNTFCKVKLIGEELNSVILIPREAIHNNKVYIIKNNKLIIKPIKIQSIENNTAIISEGIEEADKVIVTDVFPVFENMKIRGHEIKNPITVINTGKV